MDDNISYLAVVIDNVKDEIAWGETFDYLDDAFEWSYNLKQDLWYAEQKHEQATYLLDNELWSDKDDTE